MAFESNDIKGIIILALFAIPMVASTNINCSGRAFHCVNSTHFMICVDLGGGVSNTIDDFVIPCPATTVCNESNVFECDFPEVITPPLQVIGVNKQSDTSEPFSVTNSEISPMPMSEILNVFKENITGTTLSIPVVKLEVLEDIKNPVGVNSDNTREASYKVTSSFIDSGNEVVNDKQTTNTIITSATDNNKNLEPTVETSINAPANTSSTDKSKSIDTVTSVIGLINLISTDLPSAVNTKPSSDVLTSLEPFYENIATTTEQYITKKVTILGEKVENVTEKIIIPTEFIFNERSATTDKESTIPVVNMYIESNINNTTEFNNTNDNQPNAVENSLGKSNNTSELVPETTTEYLAPINIITISEPVTVNVNPHTMTDNTFVPLGLVDIIAGDTKQNASSTNEYINTFYDDTPTTTTDQYNTKLETTLSDKSGTEEVINTTPIVNTIYQNILKNDVNNDSFAEFNSTVKISTLKKLSETNINYIIPEPITIRSQQTTTEQIFVPITAEANAMYTTDMNDLLVEKHTTAYQPLEIIITTESPIEPTDNLYQINREIKQTMITDKNYTASTINTTDRAETVLNASSTDIINKQVTELLNPAVELTTAETLHDELTVHAINDSISVNEANLENVGINTPLSGHTTPVPYNVASDLITNTTGNDLISQSDIATNPQVGFTAEIIVHKSSDGSASINHGTTQNVSADPETKIPSSLSQSENSEIVSLNLNKTDFDKDVVGMTTSYWKHVENSATTPFPSDVTGKTSLSDSVKSINQDNISATNVVKDVLIKTILPQTPSTIYYVSEISSITPITVQTTPVSIETMKISEQVSSYTPEIVDIYRASTTGYKYDSSTSLPVDVTYKTKIENVTDTPVTTLLPQESQKVGTVKLINTTSKTTETASDLVPSSVTTDEYIVVNTTDLNTTSSKFDLHADLNKIERVKPINGKNGDNYTSPSSTIKLENITTISNPSLTNDYIKTTKAQYSNAYVNATDNVPVYNLEQAVELTTQKNREGLVSIAQTNVLNSILSTPSTYTIPITEINAENVQYAGTETALPSTLEFKHISPITTTLHYVTEKTNDYIFAIDASPTKLTNLPKVKTEYSMSSVRSVLPNTAVTPDGFMTVPGYDEVTTIKDNAFIMSRTQTSPKVVTDNIKISSESPLLTKVLKTQTVKHNTDSPLSILELPSVAQIITEPTRTSIVFAQTTPLDKMNQEVPTGITIVDLINYVTSTLNNNIPQPMASLPIVGVTAAQITTELTHTTKVFAQTTPLLAAVSRINLNQGVLPGIKPTDLPYNVLSTVNRNTPQSIPLRPLIELTARQMTTELTHTTNLFTQTIPLATAVKTNKEVTSGITTTDFPTVNKNIPQSMESFPIAKVTTSQMTTEPTHSTNAFSQITPLLAVPSKTNQDVPSGIQTTDLPQYETRTVTHNTPWSSDITTETITDSLTVPDSMVETITVVGNKISGTYLGNTTLSEVMSNNPTTNNANYSIKSIKNIIDHESIVIGSNSQNTNAQNTPTTFATSVDLNRAEIVNLTESDLIRLDVGMDFETITLLSDSPIISKIETKDSIPADKIEYRLTTITKNHKDAESGALNNVTALNTIITKENKNAEVDSSIKSNIEIIDGKKYQFQFDSKHIYDSYNINNIKANITTSHNNLSRQNSTINDKLEQHLISTNHTVTTEVQSHLNESDKQSNKTSVELTLNGTSMHNPNLTSIKLNEGSNYTSVSAALGFNCSNHTRGKYADKKDCRKFYTCLGNLQPMLGACPNNTVFSEINKQCTRNLSHCVRNNQFRCLFEGRFSDFFKDNIYYICVKNRNNGFIRYKLQCQANYHINKESVKCERNEHISTRESSVSETNNDESNHQPKSEKIVSTDAFVCKNEGKFPYVKDCSKYNICDEIKNVYYICVKNRMNGFIRYKLQCQEDYHLNMESVECEKNEIISAQSVSSEIEKNNDESKPNTKLETKFSTDDFECEVEGKFPYAKDCRKYYVCTRIRNVYLRKIKKCASEEVFDKKKKMCIESDSGEC